MPERVLNTFTNPLWNYKQGNLWLQRGGGSPGKADSPPGHCSMDHVTGFQRESLNCSQQLSTLPRTRLQGGAGSKEHFWSTVLLCLLLGLKWGTLMLLWVSLHHTEVQWDQYLPLSPFLRQLGEVCASYKSGWWGNWCWASVRNVPCKSWWSN